MAGAEQDRQQDDGQGVDGSCGAKHGGVVVAHRFPLVLTFGIKGSFSPTFRDVFYNIIRLQRENRGCYIFI